MSTQIFYRDQAARQQGEADAATLDNVRSRNQLAADAWTTLADRAERADAAREQRETKAAATVGNDEETDRDPASA